MAVLLGVTDGLRRDFSRLMVRPHGEDVHLLLPAVNLQLLDGGRAIDVAGRQQGFLPFQLQLPGNLGRGRGLAGTLQSRHHDDRDGLTGLHDDLGGLAAHEGDHFLIDDFNDHLARVQAVHHVLADGPLLHRLHELLDHPEVHIGLQQGHLHFL